MAFEMILSHSSAGILRSAPLITRNSKHSRLAGSLIIIGKSLVRNVVQASRLSDTAKTAKSFDNLIVNPLFLSIGKAGDFDFFESLIKGLIEFGLVDFPRHVNRTEVDYQQATVGKPFT